MAAQCRLRDQGSIDLRPANRQPLLEASPAAEGEL